MNDAQTPTKAKTQTQIRVSDIPHILDHYGNQIKVLSLDCFDTLLWRKTAMPKDVFYAMQQRPLLKSLGVSAHQRMSAAALAYRKKFLTHGIRQIHLSDVYKNFTSLNDEQQHALLEEELLTEIECCFAFPPFVQLIRDAHARGIKVIIVSDIYFHEEQLKKLLAHHLPNDVMNAIDLFFCSFDFGKSKSDGLFQPVLQKLALPPQAVLHIGDHAIADFEAPQKAGLHALHFLQFNNQTNEFLRLQHAAASLNVLSEPGAVHIREPRYSPFRGVFATANLSLEKPESIIGYMSFGPMLYAFSRFICDEIEEMQRQGKRPKVFFLLRDAYLLSQACEAYAGKPIGKLIRLRKFATVAASFRTCADIDHYISGITPQHYNFWVICEQLLLSKELTASIVQLASTSPTPEQTFNQLIHQETIMQQIFQQSAAYKERLKRYIQKEMELEAGDTIVLVDTGYLGVTQDCLTRTFQDELNVEIVGRYFIASDEPNRPQCKALMTSTWCDHTLFEQSCTYKEGSVVDYDTEGNPLFAPLRLSDDQYVKVQAIQRECIRFIIDAKQFFNAVGSEPPFSILQQTAIAALKRHIFFPMEAEVHYFKSFQHDKDMGQDLTKTVYNLNQGITQLQNNPAIKINPYESRVVSLDMTLSTLMQRAFDLEIPAEEMSLRQEYLKIIMVRDQETAQNTIKATPTYDGYFSLFVPSLPNTHIGIAFGEKFQWLQIEKITLLNDVAANIDNHLVYNQMKRNGNIIECESTSSLLAITPIPGNTATLIYQIIFRPLVRWNLTTS